MSLNAEREEGASRWGTPTQSGKNSGVTGRFEEPELTTSADTIQAFLSDISQMPNVSGVALLAVTGDYLECLLAQGSSAPPAGTRGTAGYGLTGACLTTQAIQICNDVNQDGRIDREACVSLNVGSVMILPIKRDASLRWLIEVFSSQPNAFDWRSIRRIMRLIKRLDVNVLESRVVRTEHKELRSNQEESLHQTTRTDIDLQQLLEAAWVIQQHRADLG
jgi:hypothetical protein